MPGIVGIVSRDGQEVHHQEIQRAMQPMLQPLDGMPDGLVGDFFAAERGAMAVVSLLDRYCAAGLSAVCGLNGTYALAFSRKRPVA